MAKIALAIGFAGPWRIWFWTTYWDSLFPLHKPSDHREAKAALKRNLREAGRMAALRSMVSLPKTDTAGMLSKNKAPALIVMGTRDSDFVDAAAEAASLANILRAQSLIVDRAGHYPHVEVPDQVAPAILSFIGGVKQAA